MVLKAIEALEETLSVRKPTQIFTIFTLS